MGTYLRGRLLTLLPVVLGITLGAFALIHLVPGDPVRIMLGQAATPEAIAVVRERLGLDQSLPAQFLGFLGGLFRGDLGESVVRNAPVRTVLAARLVPTLSILLYATVIAVALAVPLAILSARYRNRAADHAIRLGTMVTFAMPTFWLGLLGVQLLSLKLHLVPVSGYERGVVHQLRYITLPAVTVGLYLAPVVIRTLRSSLIGVLDSDYIEAAYARGLAPGRVMRHHALRNAAIPALTVLSINLGFLVSGTVIVENVFDIPGLGTLLVDSILKRDYPVVQALTLVLGLAVVLINLGVDVVYALIDPRVRYR